MTTKEHDKYISRTSLPGVGVAHCVSPVSISTLLDTYVAFYLSALVHISKYDRDITKPTKYIIQLNLLTLPKIH